MTTSPVNHVRVWLDERAEEMAGLLATLVAVDSENPPGRALGRCAQVLGETMAHLGLSPEIIDLVDAPGELEQPSIVRGSVGDGDKLVYFHGHFDVVPAQELGLLRGGRIVLHLVCDEETGSVAGAGHLRRAELIDRSALAMVTAEPSAGSIWNAARGAVSVRVTVRGREAHVGQADRGVNAFQHMLHVARPVEQYAAAMAQRHTAFPMDPDDATGTMLVVGGLSGGGSNFNVVPGSAYFTVDGRYNPEENLEDAVKHLTALIDDAAGEIGADVSVELTQLQPSASTDASHRGAATLAAVVAAVEGAPARFEMCAGILETRWYAQLGIPAFGYGAGRLDVSHGPDEYIDEAAMRRCAAVYALYAGEMLA